MLIIINILEIHVYLQYQIIHYIENFFDLSFVLMEVI